MPQCYFKDSGLIFDKGKNGETEQDFQNAPWFDSAIHATCDAVYTWPDESEERRAFFYVPNLNIIVDNRDPNEGGKLMHPLLKALIENLGLEWEDVEDKIEAAGGLRKLIDRLDIDRLARRIKKIYLAGNLTQAQVQKIKQVFGHLTSELD